MTLKEILKKSNTNLLNKNEKGNLSFSNKVNLILYPLIVLIIFLIYSSTYSFINNQKSKNEQNLEKFFASNEFKGIKKSIFENLKSPYLEFKYKIENNDSIGKILKKFKVSDKEVQKIVSN